MEVNLQFKIKKTMGILMIAILTMLAMLLIMYILKLILGTQGKRLVGIKATNSTAKKTSI